MDTCKVYIQTDESENVIAVASSAFLSDPTGWTQIDEGRGDRFRHAQGNYFPKPIVTSKGISRYKFVGGEVIAKSDAEIESEEAAIVPPMPLEQRIDELQQEVSQLTLTIETLTAQP